MRATKKVPFPSLKGVVAAPASAFGGMFDILIAGPSTGFERCGDSAIVEVCGPLMQHGDFFYPSYDTIRANCLAAFKSDAKTVVLRIDSPGGDFAGSLELSKALRDMARQSGKRLVAFTDTMAASAAYALACAADEIVITPSAYVGSVGVWAMLADQTAQDRMMGINIAIVASGSRKADRNPHVPISEGSLSALQIEVDAMAALFFGVVSDLRSMSLADVIALQGAQDFGVNAISARLADRIVNSWEDLLSPTSNSAAKATGTGARTMGMKEEKASYRAKLAKLAASDDDEGKEAAAALSDFDKDEDKKSKKAAAKADEGGADEDKEKAKAADEEDKQAKAKAEEEEKEKAKAAAQAQAQAAAGESELTIKLAAEVQALKAGIAAKALADERATLLAKRPDFTKEVRDTLAGASVETLRTAVNTWPKIATAADEANAALVPGATRGQASSTDAPGLSKEDAAHIKEKMSVGNIDGVIVSTPQALSVGFMSRAAVRKRLAELAKEGDK